MIEVDLDRGTMRSVIARAMRRQRRHRGVSAKAVSLKLGMPSFAVHNIENGMAWLPDRVGAYLGWLGYGGDYFALESFVAELPEQAKADQGAG